MNILFIVKVKFLFLLYDHLGPSTYVETRMVNKYLTPNPISLKHMSFLVSILGFTPSHTPLKYKCPIKISIE